MIKDDDRSGQGTEEEEQESIRAPTDAEQTSDVSQRSLEQEIEASSAEGEMTNDAAAATAQPIEVPMNPDANVMDLSLSSYSESMPMDTSITLPRRRSAAATNSSGATSVKKANAAPPASSLPKLFELAEPKDKEQEEGGKRNDEWLENFIDEGNRSQVDVSGEQQPEPDAPDDGTKDDMEAGEPQEVGDDAEKSEPMQDRIREKDAADEDVLAKVKEALSTPGSPLKEHARLELNGSHSKGVSSDRKTAGTEDGTDSLLSSVFEADDSGDHTHVYEDDDEPEEEEPSLNYEKLKGGAADVLKKDTASAMAVSDRFLALGTHAGMIYILDVEGNLVKGFRSHTASILDLDIDSTSEFVASAGMDGET